MSSEPLYALTDLVQVLQRAQVPHGVEAPGESVRVTTPHGEQLVTWDAQHGVVSWVHPFGGPVPEDRLTDVAWALLSLNHALLVPGLGIDPGSRIPCFRRVLALGAKGYLLSGDATTAFEITAQSVANCAPVIGAVVRRQIAPGSVAQAFRDHMARSAPS